MEQQSNVTSVVGSNAVAARTGPDVKRSVNLTDRVLHLEAMTLSFICENTLSLTIAPKLVHFAKACASDPRALKKLPAMNRTTATYKIKHGLAENRRRNVVSWMRIMPFSVNIDECTSKTSKKVSTILVMYLQHYKSFELLSTKAELITEKILAYFDEDDIPLNNLISDLSDSTNYMRGKKGGVAEVGEDSNSLGY